MSVKPGRLLAAEDLLQSHICVDRTLPKVGTKDFKPTGSWLEKKQIQTTLEECKQLLEEERVEKLGTLAEAFWNERRKLAEVTRKVGKHWQTMGFEMNGKLFLYPEEALHLLETNCLELHFHGVPMSVQQAYSMLLGNGSSCSLKEYRTYACLTRQGFRLLRHSRANQPTNYEHQIRLDQHVVRKRALPDVERGPGSSQTPTFVEDRNPNPGTSRISPSKRVDDSLHSEDSSETQRGHPKSKNGGAGDEVSFKNESEDDMEVESDIPDVYMTNTSVKEEPGASETMKDFAQSIVDIGKSLIKTENKNDDEESRLNTLKQKILDMLENHFQGHISPETIDAVSLSASKAILVHVSNENSENPNEQVVTSAIETSERSDQTDRMTRPAIPTVAASSDASSLSNGSQSERIIKTEQSSKDEEPLEEPGTTPLEKTSGVESCELSSENSKRKRDTSADRSSKRTIHNKTSTLPVEKGTEMSASESGERDGTNAPALEQLSKHRHAEAESSPTDQSPKKAAPKKGDRQRAEELTESAASAEGGTLSPGMPPESAASADGETLSSGKPPEKAASVEGETLSSDKTRESAASAEAKTHSPGKPPEKAASVEGETLSSDKTRESAASAEAKTHSPGKPPERAASVESETLSSEKHRESAASAEAKTHSPGKPPESTASVEGETLSSEKSPESAASAEVETLSSEKPPGSPPNVEGETLSSEKFPESAASAEVETLSSEKPPENTDNKEIEAPLSETPSEGNLNREDQRRPTSKDAMSTMHIKSETTEKSVATNVVNNCDITPQDTQRNRSKDGRENPETNQQTNVDQLEISDSLEDTEKLSGDNSKNSPRENSVDAPNNVEIVRISADDVSVENRGTIDLIETDEPLNSLDNITENTTERSQSPVEIVESNPSESSLPVSPESSLFQDESTAEDILDCEVSDAEIEEVPSCKSQDTSREGMAVDDDDIVELDDPHSWRNVKVERASAQDGNSSQKRNFRDSNGWRGYKESLSDSMPRKKRRLADVSIEIVSDRQGQSDIELIDITEDVGGRLAQPKKEIEVVDLDESDSSESDNDSRSEDIPEVKPNVTRLKEPPKVMSAFERARDHRRKQIMDSFPNMFDKVAMTVAVPCRHLLPPNISPAQTMYTIHRRSLHTDRPQRRFQHRYFNAPRFNYHSNAPRNNHPRQPNTHAHGQFQARPPRFNAPVRYPQERSIPLSMTPLQAFEMIANHFRAMFQASANFNMFGAQQPMMLDNQPFNPTWTQPPPRSYTPWQSPQPWRFQPRAQTWNNNRPARPWQPRQERPNLHERDQDEVPERPKRPNIIAIPRPTTPWIDTRGTTCEPVQADARRPKQFFGFRSKFKPRKPTRDFISDIKEEIRWRKVQAMNAAASDSDSSDNECSGEVTITPVQRSLGDSGSALCPLLRPDQCVDSASIMASVQVVARADLSDFTFPGQCRCLKISFDMYQPTTPFKKSHPPKPSFRLCVMGIEEAVPTTGEIAILLDGIHDGVPLLFALVHPDDISFYHYTSVEIPKQTFST